MNKPSKCPECGAKIDWESEDGGMCSKCKAIILLDKEKDEVKTITNFLED